ncbi:MAG: urea amidolyase related protein [Sedimentibacter sp.]|jgi:biotin-dependent carboxylase-like uncharacterized protein|nr:urea amidolyase related protein [Sedimentibacter sp.]
MGQFRIVDAGFMTTVQDLGRYGYQQYGVSVSGAMDYVAAKLANILVGNDENEGLLEATMIGPKIEFLDAAVIAITGGDMQPVINGVSLNLNKSISVNKGDSLTFRGMKKGLRSYIAFTGGIDVPVVMGSKSTFLKAQIGGYEGRALRAGDILSTGLVNNVQFGREIAENYYDYGSGKVELRVVLGPQDDAFTENGIENFFNSEFRVTNNCDRMGYTLEGENIEHKDGADIISDGISMGAIQVPNSGNLIIMMADRQTTGGYTKIANVITADLPKIAQAKPGDVITFKKSTLEEAHMLFKELENRIDEVKIQLYAQAKNKTEATKAKMVKIYNITVNGTSYGVKVEEL